MGGTPRDTGDPSSNSSPFNSSWGPLTLPGSYPRQGFERFRIRGVQPSGQDAHTLYPECLELMHLVSANMDSGGNRSAAIHLGDLDWVPGSWLPVLADAGFWGVI